MPRADDVRRFRREHLGTDIAVDPTHKQGRGPLRDVDDATRPDAPGLLGSARVEFQGGKITSFDLAGRAA